jgi:alkanesulfonate monooxygenase SsuD/methylene tetrahydromethanopterin reductase-like flavin-dependent oxidoreductase (luciferase family)
MVEVVRLVSSGERVSYSGVHTRFENVVIDPPPQPKLTVWYGGASKQAREAIASYADGLLPGRCPFSVYDRAVARLVEALQPAGRSARLGSIPIVSLGRNRHEAESRLPLDALLTTASGRWKRSFDSPSELAGAVIAGNPNDCADQVGLFEERDVELLVLDFRLRMEDFEAQVEQFATEVMPHFQEGRAESPSI